MGWYLTFLVGFSVLAPSTDDGYYVIASLGTALTGRPGFWIGDEFAPVFFLPVAFTYFYGVLLKLTMITGLDFGPLGFRFYQFLIIFLLPVASLMMFRRLLPGSHSIRFLLFTVLLSITYFVQSAPTVRPEVLGALLFIAFLSLIKKDSTFKSVPILVLALSGTVHPNFTLLAGAVFAVLAVRHYQLNRLSDLREWAVGIAVFAVPFLLLASFFVFNLSEFQAQTLGRTSVLSTAAWSSPPVVWQGLVFWDDPGGMAVGMFSGYPAYGFVLAMAASTFLMIRRRSELWADGQLWVCWPIFVVQWFVFLLLPAFLPYLAFSSVLASLVVVLLWRPSEDRISTKNFRFAVAGAGLGLCLVFIVFQGGKFVVSSEERLTPSGFHSTVSPIFDQPDTKFYTSSARLIPPLIDYFSDEGSVRVNFTYLSPNCFGEDLLKRANLHASSVLLNADSETTYWGLDRSVSGLESVDIAAIDSAEASFLTKGSVTTVNLTLQDHLYLDTKNVVARASAVSVKLDDRECVPPAE